MASLPNWPPKLSEDELASLTTLATTYALAHGLLHLPVHAGSDNSVAQPAPSSAIHVPLALFPSPFPRKPFERVQRLQTVYNVLYSRVAMDHSFLDCVMGDLVQSDQFIGTLWKGWEELREKGMVQPLQLGIFRSDYLLHSTCASNEFEIKQVEFNTISSAAGSLSQAISNLHRYLYAANRYYNSSPLLHQTSFPPNQTIAGLVAGFVEAHTVYGVPNAHILFVVQKGERNVFDQRWLEYELLARHGIHVTRQTLEQLTESASLSAEDRALRITNRLHPQGLEISIVYFRAGYTPDDYTTPSAYKTRFLLEESKAIKCPSIALQLAGGKKVQQALSKPGILESFLCDSRWGKQVFGSEVLADLRGTWVEMWSLDEEAEVAIESGYARARQRAAELVLKPQREGGGNNVFKADIPPLLDTFKEEDLKAWIAMELIQVPPGGGNWFVRPRLSGSTAAGRSLETEVVNELGIFGWSLFGDTSTTAGQNEYRLTESGYVGWLVRTKGVDRNEGGVAAGYSVLSSIFLVD